ncbi:MAG: hypothetical protein CSB23_05415 [Deltaproteobacteria bacterium]|nr:MAG: hypothetical protein CSB23_05415 [Deltaproteobacteria bacterium]
MYIISSCLLGLCTRYDGKIKRYPKAETYLEEATLIPICPEQLGGLPTPREPADIQGGNAEDVLDRRAKVVTHSGLDVTDPFLVGAKQTLRIALQQNVQTALLKARSPSCGVHGIVGVTAALLKRHGIKTVEID